jgi:hypothetical protein
MPTTGGQYTLRNRVCDIHHEDGGVHDGIERFCGGYVEKSVDDAEPDCEECRAHGKLALAIDVIPIGRKGEAVLRSGYSWGLFGCSSVCTYISRKCPCDSTGGDPLTGDASFIFPVRDILILGYLILL